MAFTGHQLVDLVIDKQSKDLKEETLSLCNITWRLRKMFLLQCLDQYIFPLYTIEGIYYFLP